jgi:hypothetical protein
VSIDRVAAALLIGLPIAFNIFFFLLARLFDYPSVLRSPAGLILNRFLAGGLRLKLVWYGFRLGFNAARLASLIHARAGARVRVDETCRFRGGSSWRRRYASSRRARNRSRRGRGQAISPTKSSLVSGHGCASRSCSFI